MTFLAPLSETFTTDKHTVLYIHVYNKGTEEIFFFNLKKNSETSTDYYYEHSTFSEKMVNISL